MCIPTYNTGQGSKEVDERECVTKVNTEPEMAIDALNKEVEIVDGIKQIDSSKVYEILKQKGYRQIHLSNPENEA